MICVIRPGALGDAILTLPVLESLGAGSSGREITVLGPAAFGLAADCGLADAHVAFDDPRLLGLFTEGGAAELLSGCETCLVYGKGPNALLAASLRRSGVARLVEWPAWPEPGKHIVDHLLGAVEAAGCCVATREPRLPPQASWLAAADSFLAQHGVRGCFAAIHPGSGGRAKRWPAARFAELAARLPWPAVWLLGPAEMEGESVGEWERESVKALGRKRRPGFSSLASFPAFSLSHALTLSPSHAPSVAVDLPLRTLAGVLARCSVYVGNDSGVSHLAAAVGAPTVAIFGPTDPRVWGPRGPRVQTVGGPDAGGLDAVTVEDVLGAVHEACGSVGAS